MNLRIIILAGPNGAGKTTFAREYLPREGNCLNFINADLIAAGLSPFKPDEMAVEAGRLMLSEIKRFVAKRESFCFETTLSGRVYSRMIPAWQKAGYRVELIFLKLKSTQLAINRVKMRVKQGGHNIPVSVIRRRFKAGLENYEELYKPLVDSWELCDNSGMQPILIDLSENRMAKTKSSLLEKDSPVLIALKRSAKKACEIAIATDTGCMVIENGKIIDLTRRRKASAQER